MLEARDITLTIGRTPILNAASLSIAPGRVTALVGPNGAGKSTLLACLSGAIVPQGGAVRMDGDNPARLSAAALGLRRAVLDQTPSVAAPFTLEELIELGIPRAISPVDARRITRDASAALGLTRLRERSIDALSGGERHRAHMARALAQLNAGRMLGGGRWLLLDEPTASLDLRHQASVMQAARQAAADGVGVLAVLHDLSLAAAMADTVAVMQSGSIVASGAPRACLTSELLGRVYGIEIAVSEPRAGLQAIVPIYTSNGEDHRCSSP
ncbi:MAG: ATP-binding cassette domain-containing protein [Pseudomonadota bacterium]